MRDFKGLIKKGIKLAEQTAEQAVEIAGEASKKAQKYWEENKDELQKQVEKGYIVGKEFVSTGFESASESATSIYRDIRYSDNEITRLQKSIVNQGGLYRELNRRYTAQDSIAIGGETLVSLLAASTIPDDIVNAYEAAYPDLSATISFEDKVRELEPDALVGFISGVKGKLFEQQYIAYLNQGNLPDGYTAVLAESATQKGWDIAIEGSNGEIASVLQAKATDSASYVQDAIEKYPNIDVVTTEEVYSHLVMSGISENIAKGSISNAELMETLDQAVDAAELSMDFTPPLFALAFIAFTSYKDESLTLYEKARSAGDR